jgi:hypothetical protein
MTTRIAPARLWFGLVAAPAAWAVDGLLGWFFGAQICTAMSIATVRIIVGVLGLAALAVAAAGLSVGVANWRVAAGEPRPAADRVEFMSLGGVLVSTAFVIGIFWAALNPLFIGVCGGMR